MDRMHGRLIGGAVKVFWDTGARSKPGTHPHDTDSPRLALRSTKPAVHSSDIAKPVSGQCFCGPLRRRFEYESNKSSLVILARSYTLLELSLPLPLSLHISTAVRRACSGPLLARQAALVPR
jgi:hypothetical protein